MEYPATASAPATPRERGSNRAFRIGPLLGGGLPNVLSLGGMVKISRYFGAGINFGLIPTMQISVYGQASVSYNSMEAYARVFPFGNAFFLGAGLGYATISGRLSKTIAAADYYPYATGTVEFESDASVQTAVFTPNIGILKTWDSGFTLGIDAGVQLPVAPSQAAVSNPEPTWTGVPSALQKEVEQSMQPYVDDTRKQVVETLQGIGRTIIPTVSLRIGWLF